MGVIASSNGGINSSLKSPQYLPVAKPAQELKVSSKLA
jgi:hypothetical protein